MEMPAADPEQPMPGFVGGNTLLRELSDEAIDRLVSFREANPASVLFLRSLGGAFGDVPQDDTPFPARDATWFAMAGAFDIPGLSTTRAGRCIQAEWDAIEALGKGSTATSRRRPTRRRRAHVPAGHDGTPRRDQAPVGPAEPLLPVPQRATRLTRRGWAAASPRQCVSSASISVRSPDHRVWKVPGLSTRL